MARHFVASDSVNQHNITILPLKTIVVAEETKETIVKLGRGSLGVSKVHLEIPKMGLTSLFSKVIHYLCNWDKIIDVSI